MASILWLSWAEEVAHLLNVVLPFSILQLVSTHRAVYHIFSNSKWVGRSFGDVERDINSLAFGTFSLDAIAVVDRGWSSLES